MKTLLITLLSLISFSALAINFNDIAGSYEVTSEYAPVVNTIEIGENGSIKLTEVSPYGTFSCSGHASIENDVVISEVICEEGTSFTQKVDLNGVVISNEFQANVYSSLYEVELPMTFKKL